MGAVSASCSSCSEHVQAGSATLVIQQAKATATLEQRRFRENSDVLSQLKQLAYLV